MDGLMMDFQLTIPTLLRRAESYFGDKEIVTRLPDKSFHRYTYADMARRAKQLAVALGELGLERGDRVATLSWNHYQHLEAYFGIPCGGFVLHTLNIRLHPNDIGYIAAHAGDRALIVDASLAPLVDQFRDQTQIEHVLVVEDSYEELLASADPNDWIEPELDENEAAAMCYTSGTTGMPKGVVYSHRSTILHTLGVAAANPLGVGIAEQDSLLPVVPMFHANAWGYPYLAAMVGTKLKDSWKDAVVIPTSREFSRHSISRVTTGSTFLPLRCSPIVMASISSPRLPNPDSNRWPALVASC